MELLASGSIFPMVALKSAHVAMRCRVRQMKYRVYLMFLHVFGLGFIRLQIRMENALM
jgi:hypothetical protein